MKKKVQPREIILIFFFGQGSLVFFCNETTTNQFKQGKLGTTKHFLQHYSSQTINNILLRILV